MRSFLWGMGFGFGVMGALVILAVLVVTLCGIPTAEELRIRQEQDALRKAIDYITERNASGNPMSLDELRNYHPNIDLYRKSGG